MTPVIRLMQQQDLAQVRELAAACPEAPQWPDGVYSTYLPAGEPGPIRRAALVAERDGAILGFAAVTLLLDPPGGGTAENRCELDSIAVSPAARRQGIGVVLLRSVLAWAAENGARRLSLEVRAGNTAALALYQRIGLRLEGRRPRYYLNPEEDAVLLGTVITQVPKTPSFSTENSVEGGPPQC